MTVVEQPSRRGPLACLSLDVFCASLVNAFGIQGFHCNSPNPEKFFRKGQCEEWQKVKIQTYGSSQRRRKTKELTKARSPSLRWPLQKA